MGQTTSNISIYIPADGETLYGPSFSQGMLNVDLHDHSGPPTKGVPISATGLADYSVTAIKLNNMPPTSVADPAGGLGFNPTTNALKTEGLLLALFGVSTIGFLTQTATGPTPTAEGRTLSGATGQATAYLINITNPQGIAGNPSFSVPQNFITDMTAATPSIINIQTLDTPGPGTYTPTTNMIYCIIEVIGGGGGGGGSDVTSAAGSGSVSAGGGGGQGGYSRGVFTKAQIGLSIAINVGAAGAAGVAGPNTGGTGGTTSVGATLIQATGGVGGGGGTAGAVAITLGGAGGVGTLGLVNTTGNSGSAGFGTAVTGAHLAVGGSGAASYFGGSPVQVGDNATGQSTGNAATAYGAGGGGGDSCNGGTTAAGGAGAAGVIVITEFIHA